MERRLTIREQEKNISSWFYNLGFTFKNNNNCIDALSCFCITFLIRGDIRDNNPLWIDFYKIQMSLYILGKENMRLSLPEGDMVYNLIRDKWIEILDEVDNSPFGPIQNIHEWFKTVQIDFPFVLDQYFVI